MPGPANTFRRALLTVLGAMSALCLSAAQPALAGNGDVAPIGAPDGRVQIADALVTLRMALALTAADLNADVAPLGNPDGQVTVADALVVLRSALNLVEIPAVGLTGQPSLGLVRNAPVTLYQADGTTVLAGGTTTSTGVANLYHAGLYSGPVLIEVSGGGQAEYFDEASGNWVALAAGEQLHALSPLASGAVAVTPLTEAAYRMALAANLIGNGVSITEQAVNALNERVRQNLAPEIADILTPPTLVANRPANGAGTLGTSDADRYALRLAALAQVAADNGSDVIQLMHDLAADIADDGEINRSGSASAAPYGSTFTSELFTAIQNASAHFAGSSLQQLVVAGSSPFRNMSPSVPFSDINAQGGSALMPTGTGAALASGRGATGTFNGTTYTFTQPEYLALPTNVALFMAMDGADPITRWTIGTFEPRLGMQPCGPGGHVPNIMLTLNGVPYLADECTIVVTSLAFDHIEGRFAATFKDQQGQVFTTVTDGYFRYDPPGQVQYDFGTNDGLPVLDNAAGTYNVHVWRSNHPSQGIGPWSFDMARTGNQGSVTGTPVSVTTNEPLGAPYEIAGDLDDIWAAGFLSPSAYTAGAYRFVFIDIAQPGTRPTFTAFIWPTGLITGTYSDANGTFDFTNSVSDRYGNPVPAELTNLAGAFQADGYFFVQGPLEFAIAANGDVSYTDPASCSIKTVAWNGNGDYVTRHDSGSMSVRMDDGTNLVNFFVDGRGIWEFRIGEANGTQIYRTTGPSTGNFGDYGLSLCQAQASDTTPPVFDPVADVTLNAAGPGGTPLPDYGVTQYLNSVTASDTILGWSNAATVTNNAPDPLPLGPTLVTFTATDAAGNQATTQATITIADLQGPAISAPSHVTLAAQDAFGLPLADAAVQAFITGVSASDNIDGAVAVTHNIPAQLSYGGNTVKFFAVDAAGNSSEAQTVISVLDQSAPQLTPPPDTTVAAVDATGTTSAAADVQAFVAGLVATDNVSSVQALNIAHDLPATLAMGAHTVTFTVQDGAGNSATISAVLTVADKTAPQVSLLGAPHLTVLQNSAYQEPGATAQDNVDGDLTASIVVSGTVDLTTLGDYTLTYAVTDTAGNTGSVQRLVTVTDKVPPPPWAMLSPPLTANAMNRVVHTGTRFIAVGNGGVILTSDDGANWAVRNSGIADDLRDVIWDGSRAIAVGGSGTTNADGVLITSADGITWSSPVTVTNNVLQSVVYGNGEYLVSDYLGNLLVSSDLANWSQQYKFSVGVLQLDFDSNASRLIAVGNNFASYSDNGGINWITTTNAGQLRDVLAANGKVLLSGAANRLVDFTSNYSTMVTKNSAPYADYNGLCWDGTRWMLAGSGGAFYSSLTATNKGWTKHETGFSAARFNAVACNAGTAVAVGSNREVVSTDDLSTFVHHNQPSFEGQPYTVLQANGVFLLQTQNGLVYSDDEGITWNSLAISCNTSSCYLASDGSQFYRYHYINQSSSTLFTSTDAVNWAGPTSISTSSVPFPLSRSPLYTDLNGASVWAWGRGDGAIMVSLNQGASWSQLSSGSSDSVTNVVKVGSQLIAVGNQGKLLTSPDGLTWTTRTTNLPLTPSNGSYGWRLTDAATDGTDIVVVGNDPTWTSAHGYNSVILRSTDGGVSWTPSVISGASLQSVEYSGSHWVATNYSGEGAWVSTDGVLWSGIGAGFPNAPNGWLETPKINGKVYIFGNGTLSVINP